MRQHLQPRLGLPMAASTAIRVREFNIHERLEDHGFSVVIELGGHREVQSYRTGSGGGGNGREGLIGRANNFAVLELELALFQSVTIQHVIDRPSKNHPRSLARTGTEGSFEGEILEVHLDLGSDRDGQSE